MPTQVDLSKVPRRDFRYVLFCLQNGTRIVKTEHQYIADDVAKLVHDIGRKVEYFAVTWDFGIDDWRTMFMRPESWFCWGIKRTASVDKPMGIPLSEGLARIVAAGFGTHSRGSVVYSPDDHKSMFTQGDYMRILEGVADRKGW
jgi:hypothetical protein